MRSTRRRTALTVLAAICALPLAPAIGGAAVANNDTPAQNVGVHDGWQPPVGLPVTIGEKFDPPSVRWSSGHRGVDLCPPTGTPVYAPNTGTVIYAGKLVDRNVVSVRHGSGVRSTFEPVSPEIQVGARVNTGDLLGTLEEGHTDNCLHWGLKVNRDLYLNPLGVLIGPPVLKPLNQ